jgi:hypothetical protein
MRSTFDKESATERLREIELELKWAISLQYNAELSAEKAYLETYLGVNDE